jgi:hypothetical protein
MHKLEVKTKHQNKTQNQKKMEKAAASSPPSPVIFIVGRPNPTGRPPSPVTIIARKKKKTKLVSSSLPAGQTQPADHHLRSKPSLKNRF